MHFISSKTIFLITLLTYGQLAKMVKGLAAVDWKKPENNAKLFAAVLASIPGTLDYKKIAAVFGESASSGKNFGHQKQLYDHIAMAFGLKFCGIMPKEKTD